jgi:WD40 repeat protein
MDNTLTLIAQYLFRHGHSELAQGITKLSDFNPSHRQYLQIKHEITEIILFNDTLTSDIIDEIIIKLKSLTSDLNISELSFKIKITILTILFLEELFINKNTENALSILKSLPAETDLSTRQNLSSLLLQNDTPNVFLCSINWKNINSINESRNLLIENLFRLLPSSVYLFSNGMESLMKDAYNYQQLSIPSFNSNSNSNSNSNLSLNSINQHSNLPINLKQTLNYHTNEVWFIKYSPNGKYLATGSKDTKIIIYDVENNYKLEAVFQLHTESITYLSWNSSSTEILSLSFDQTLRIWSIELNKCIKELDNKKSLITQARLSAAKFLPDYESNNQILIASNDGKLFIVSLVDKITPPELICEYTKVGLSPQIQDFTIQNNFIWAITITSELLVFSLPDLKLIYKMQFNSMPVAITSVSSSFPGIISNNTSISEDDKNYVLINLKPSSLVLINTSGINTNSSNKISNGGKLPYLESFFHLPAASASNFIIRGCAGGNYNPKLKNQANSGIIISGGRSGEIWLWGYEGNILGCVNEHEGLVNCVSWRGDGYANENIPIEWASGSDDGKVCIWGV